MLSFYNWLSVQSGQSPEEQKLINLLLFDGGAQCAPIDSSSRHVWQTHWTFSHQGDSAETQILHTLFDAYIEYRNTIF